MQWHLEAEVISSIVVLIIIIYSGERNMIPSFKNKVFKGCLYTTFFAIILNLGSTILINCNIFPLLTYVVTMLYFIATPMMALMYLYYIISFAYEERNGRNKAIALSFIPYGIYLLIVLSNPFTQFIFTINAQSSYTRGPLILTTYIVFYIYCFACFIVTALSRKYIQRSTSFILYAFPAIAVLVILVQQLIPDYLLSGSAAMCALLIIYLYLQNKRITVDQLTGAYNRQAYTEILSLKIKQRRKFTIIVVSLSGFKFINDKFGQQSGDAFLKAISEYLKSLVLTNAVYRCSGDEFAILLERIEAEFVREMIKKVKDRFQKPWKVKGADYMLTAYISIAEYPKSAETPEDLINALEHALHKVKISNHKDIIYCGHKMIEEIRRKRRITDILKRETQNHGFEVHYQPMAWAMKDQFTVAESLLRLKDDDLGMISPNEFIPIAEECGLIVDITYIVLNKVCRYVKHLMDLGKRIDGISVNLSVLHFMQGDIVERIIEIIEHNQVPYSKIKLEITESVVASNYDLVVNALNRMREYGILFSLDDFGTGYSNISNVIDLPIHTIKIDKSLIWGAMENEKCAVMTRELIGAFGLIGLCVVVEGVETQEHADFVKDAGCDLIQGYLYAKPMQGQDAEKYFQSMD